MKIIANAWSVTLFLQKAWKSVTLQAFLLILGENHWKRLECHTFLARKHQQVWHSKFFLLCLDENHWKRLECRTFLAKNMKKCDTSSVFADFRWKSLKTLGVSHFSGQKHEKVWHSKRFGYFKWKSLKTLGVSHFSYKKHEKVWHFKRFCWF